MNIPDTLENLLEFANVDRSIPIFIKNPERSSQSLLGENTLLINGSSNELRVINGSIIVRVHHCEDPINLFIRLLRSHDLLEPGHQFLPGELPVTVCVECLENSK